MTTGDERREAIEAAALKCLEMARRAQSIEAHGALSLAADAIRSLLHAAPVPAGDEQREVIDAARRIVGWAEMTGGPTRVPIEDAELVARSLLHADGGEKP